MTVTPISKLVITQSINQSKHISIAPYVASESEAHAAQLMLFLLNYDLLTFNYPRFTTIKSQH